MLATLLKLALRFGITNGLRKLFSILVVRHPENQALAALPKTIAAIHLIVPVFFRQREIALFVEQKCIF